jgi:hypothetical protein
MDQYINKNRSPTGLHNSVVLKRLVHHSTFISNMQYNLKAYIFIIFISQNMSIINGQKSMLKGRTNSPAVNRYPYYRFQNQLQKDLLNNNLDFSESKPFSLE